VISLFFLAELNGSELGFFDNFHQQIMMRRNVKQSLHDIGF
jgi:hypothetical protein